jgi:hypothetical protein
LAGERTFASEVAARGAGISAARPARPQRAICSPVASEWTYEADRPDVWTWLQAWFVEQCNGDWEHDEGISIGTLDNPGWWVKINLEDTALAGLSYEDSEIHRSEDDWCVTRVAGNTFHADRGPTNLAEALHSFRAWATGGTA